MEDFIWSFDDVLNQQECQDVINEFDRLAEIIKPVDSKHVHGNNRGNRSDLCIMFDDQSPVMAGLIRQQMQPAMDEYVSHFPGISNTPLMGIAVKVQRTEPGGGFHQWHCEQASIEAARRALVWTIYLNDIEEGGETEFLHQSKRVKPEAGKLSVFPAAFTHLHRGNPPLSQVKYIATGWWYISDLARQG